MKVSFDRIFSAVKSLGYFPVRRTRHSFFFVCHSSIPDLFLEIGAEFQGRKHEAVYGTAGISVTRWVPRIAEDGITVVELASDKDRNWAIISSKEDALDWECRFADLAPRQALEFAERHGEELLTRTCEARTASKRVLGILNPYASLDSQIAEFERELLPAQTRLAKRLANWPGVLEVYDAEAEYLLACYAVIRGEPDLQSNTDPVENDRLMWQIQLVADGILNWTHTGKVQTAQTRKN